MCVVSPYPTYIHMQKAICSCLPHVLTQNCFTNEFIYLLTPESIIHMQHTHIYPDESQTGSSFKFKCFFFYFILSTLAQRRTQFLLNVQLVLPPYAMQSGDLTIYNLTLITFYAFNVRLAYQEFVDFSRYLAHPLNILNERGCTYKAQV